MATSNDLESLLPRLLALFVDAVHPHTAILCLREGDRLRTRATHSIHAAVGSSQADEDAASDFSLPFDPQDETLSRPTDGTPRLVSPTSHGAPASAGPPASPGAPGAAAGIATLPLRNQAVYLLPLHDAGKLVATIWLGTSQPREFSHGDKRILERLARGAAAAIVHLAASPVGRSRNDVLSVVAHDLQNPITVISIAANTLLQRLSESSVRRPIERIIRSAQRAARLIQDLQEIDAVETGRFSIELHPIEPAEVILAAVESQQNLAADVSVILATDLSPELPAFDADEERLFEVLENLIGNALKFTAPGGSITVGATHRAREVLLWVKDTGAGISPEQMPHIFDRFWQAKKADRRGTGLGLTICKAIVEAHGGRIWAESTPHVGTTMYFTIPAVQRMNETARAGAREESEPDVANILLVDDRPENLLALEAILAQPGYRLVTAASGEDALRLALRETFSVALLDISMPGMNGLEVAVHLKALERSRDIPIIFVTAFGDDPQEIHRAYSAGGADYLVKPLDAEIVRKKVAVFVDLSRRRRDHPATKHRTT
ncbi:ATP-binding protein [Pendulispora albinea]|uniref:histidine kinase n=1 Tax=Pendulispora albinea TaxID=2741071 RepID=A0ABZ2LME4_9BACT